MDRFPTVQAEPVTAPSEEPDSIRGLKLKPRTFNILWQNRLRTVSELERLSKKELLSLYGMGHEGLDDLLQKLRAYDLDAFEHIQQAPDRWLDDDSIRQLGLQTLTFNLLWRNGIRTISALTLTTNQQLLAIPGFGPACVDNVSKRLEVVRASRGSTAPKQRALQLPLFDLSREREMAEQFRELTNRVCEPFESHGLLVELALPPRLSHLVPDADGQRVTSLLQLQAFAAQPNLENRLAEYHLEGRALAGVLAFLEEANKNRSVDDEVVSLVKQLTNRQKEILVNRFSLHERVTLEAIGSRYKITRERVRQIEKQVKSRVAHRTKTLPLFYSRAAFLLLKHMGRDATLGSWNQTLADMGFLRSDESFDLLIAIGRASRDQDLVLPDYLVPSPRGGQPSRLLPHEKSVLRTARSVCRKCGAVRAGLLTTERLAEADIGSILSSGGFTEIEPGWWTGRVERSVPCRVAAKVISCCGPVPITTMRHCVRRHLYRSRIGTPPSGVLAKALESTGQFVLEAGIIRSIVTSDKHASLNTAERLFSDMVRTQGPIVSYESAYAHLLDAGLSGATVQVLLSQSPIVHKVQYQLYTLVGMRYDYLDVERAKSELTRVSTNPSVRLRTDGTLEFETNVGNWLVYGGVLGAGPVAQMQGNWALMVDGRRQGELVVQGAFIMNMEPARDGLGLVAGDRIRIEFNTWTREAIVRKVTGNDQEVQS